MIAIGCDHAAIPFKEELLAYLKEQGPDVMTLGISEGETIDYPDMAAQVAAAVASGEARFGLLLCGTGVGMSIAANKVRGIRAVCCSEPYSAKLSREHNNSNILCMGARVVGPELAKMVLDAWLSAEFLGGRHGTRVDKIMALESGDLK